MPRRNPAVRLARKAPVGTRDTAFIAKGLVNSDVSCPVGPGTDYFDILERTQKGALDVTPWMEWFHGCVGRAFDGHGTLAAVLRKARFWERVSALRINERQRLVLNRLLEGLMAS